ncbi:MAG: 4a-hydroxytetrahydrobiopterin dehydratase [bacterium]
MKREKLSDQEIAEKLQDLPDWQRTGDKLRRIFETGNFIKGVTLVTRITPHAELMNHHPDIHLTYPKVVVEISTHDVGGITEFDFELAKRVNTAFEEQQAADQPS